MESPDGTRGLNWRAGRWIPWSEISITQKTSGGPGGQHANRSATAIDLRWKPASSCAFSPEEIVELVEHLSSRLDGDGKIRIVASDERSAARNRELALERLAQMVQEGLRPRRTRKPTRPTRSSDEKRLLQKKQRARLKKDRRRRFQDDG
ncbi:MAG: alternative ribosome rescue aminoacyl-tRNA hydrolase ArfB [Planctomycetota bacterium]|nr:alternative ribosome rescue aminoacyl-tRNA hydrolase ArfB [Planctomycetota bacterium]